MGLQDSLVMSAVPAHDVIKSRCPPSTMPTTSAIQSSKASALVETFQALTLSDDNNKQDNNLHNNETTHDNEANNKQVNIHQPNGSDDVDDNQEDGWYSDDVESDSDDVRLSRALNSWMSDYVITPLPRQGHTLRQPVFSAQLGRESNIRRAESTESIDTQLSLFSCSSHGSRKSREKKRRRLPRRRKTICAETAQELTSFRKPSSAPSGGSHGSRWVELAKRRKGELDRFMRAQTHALSQGVNLLDESEAFQLCAPDEQRALYLCGKQCKMALARMKKSPSMTNICPDPEPKKRQRVASAGAKTFFGKPLDFQELRRQMMNKRLSALSSWHRLRSSARGRSLHWSLSKTSINSAGSSDVFFSTTTPLNVSPPPSENGLGRSGGGGSRKGRAEAARRASQMLLEKSVSMWKGDSQILAIDLKRELTTNVKRRIAGTTSALERVTGLGDNNEQKADYTCHLREFPAFVDEDYGLRPKIPQKIRISPQLSDVIKSDIRVRMGRPRYHEIRVQDLAMWNRGQTLDRAHRNLKVFNWLHSLKEDQFDVSTLQQRIIDGPPTGEEDFAYGDMVLIRAVDDPDVKPLFERIKKSFVR